ncbi:MAG TPA: hypothetical protein VFE86_10360, partial [Ilumatobacteraceae bacterium]|nr:hypothetical protein [Ilumatobacteraceae bacterium]
MAASNESLFIVLLTGGGLAVVGSIIGQAMASRTALSREREARRDARRQTLLDFRREAIVAFQDLLVTESELANDDYAGRSQAEFRTRLLFTRIGDRELEELWAARQAQSGSAHRKRELPTRAEQQERMETARRLFERSGELIREIDQASTGGG